MNREGEMGKAIDLFESVFASASVGDKRSREFKEGVRASLENMEGLGKLGYRMRRCPYTAGTASFDAWFAGVREGKKMWYVRQAIDRRNGRNSADVSANN
ncbi:hypothetical protein [Desulfopila aestuarii]|nr:hypothetical protein [Desulfopila aestuarii]